MRREEFAVTGPVLFEVSTTSGDIEVLSGSQDVAIVELRGGPEDGFVVELTGGALLIKPPARKSGRRRFVSTDIKIWVPDGSSGDIRTASGDVVIHAMLENLALATASGDVRMSQDLDGDLTAKTASGDLRGGVVGGTAHVSTASGDVLLEAVGGDLTFNSASGDARVGAVAGVADARTASGDVVIDTMAGHTFEGKTLSGDVRLGIPAARIIDLDMQTLSGGVVNRLSKRSSTSEEPRPLSITVKTVSGELKLQNA